MERTFKLTNARWTYDDAAPIGVPGGFGGVFLGASDNGLAVAVKILHSPTDGLNVRELDVAKAVYGQTFRHIVKVLDYGITPDGHPCIVMELASGTLRDLILIPTTPAESLNLAETILRQICEGLNEAGDWIHRDLKPENILKVGTEWKIADFGIARNSAAETATRTYKHCMSPPYAAPEQWVHRTASHATDIYALGCIAFEILMGSPPFGFEVPDKLREMHGSMQPTLSAGPPYLRGLILRMLSKAEAARPSTDYVLSRLLEVASEDKQFNSTGKLAEVAAKISRQQAEAEAIKEEKIAKAQARKSLANAARGELFETQNVLLDHIARSTGMPKGERVGSSARPQYVVRLGDAILSTTISKFTNIGEDQFPESRWDVVCGEIIAVSSPRYSRSASLWFADVGDGEGHTWIETSYFDFTTSSNDQPCHLSPGNDADLAMSTTISHSWQLAHAPRRITGEGIRAFVDRWAGFLADGAAGTLERPNPLPERD